MTVNADIDYLDAMVKHVRKENLPLLTPKGMVSDIVLEVGDIVRGQMEVVHDLIEFQTTVREQLPNMNDAWLKGVFGKHTSAYDRMLFAVLGGHVLSETMTMKRAKDDKDNDIIIVEVHVIASMKQDEYICRLLFGPEGRVDACSNDAHAIPPGFISETLHKHTAIAKQAMTFVLMSARR